MSQFDSLQSYMFQSNQLTIHMQTRRTNCTVNQSQRSNSTSYQSQTNIFDQILRISHRLLPCMDIFYFETTQGKAIKLTMNTQNTQADYEQLTRFPGNQPN